MHRHLLSVLLLTIATSIGSAETYLLTIGGGYAPEGNQASIERNVLYYQRVLAQQRMSDVPHRILFADGNDRGHDVQVIDDTGIPAANRLMAEFFGNRTDLGLGYRNHEVSNVAGPSRAENIRDWFRSTGSQMRAGDRLLLYVTAHGAGSQSRNRPHNTSISLWGREKLTVRDMVKLLDELPDGVTVITVMVQCHAGGFARFIYEDADANKEASPRNRAGFFATVHDRQAAGCTPDADEASYVEYSTYFWEALSGRTRTNQAIELPDYDGNGVVSFEEAHAYVLLTADTIDLPIKTSGEFLGIESGFRNNNNRDLLPRGLAYSEILKLATASERAVLNGLSSQLELTGEDRIEMAEQQRGRTRRRSRRFRRGPADDLRRSIAADLQKQWPELANLMNPLSIELVTNRSEEFVAAVEGHRDYARYRQIVAAAEEELSPEKKRVKFERFVRTAENVILRENLLRLKNEKLTAKYKSLVALESSSLQGPAPGKD